jgi:hypothetical protein
LRWGSDEFFHDEEDVTPENIDYGYSVSQCDVQDWKNKRQWWADGR